MTTYVSPTMLLERLTHNPYLYGAAVLARVSVSLATVVWGIILLAHDSAFATNPNYRHMLGLVPDEDFWGMTAIVLGCVLLFRLAQWKRPTAGSACGFAAINLLWAYLWWGIVTAGYAWPTGASATTVVFGLSIYAFASNIKPGA